MSIERGSSSLEPPHLGDQEELNLMREMGDSLEQACNAERTPFERDTAMIKSVLNGRAFRDENNQDWAFDIAARTFINRHPGTPEAEKLEKILDRANDILKLKSQ